ncbi:hypothetical protein AB0J86_30385 [Micromonospora sp. NPDC049559]|uniref:hypothetical protein n=1 Tax=Micromonospora sp. NPDC049559 TaxID=3155923 RepID=UPI0034287A2C
MWTVIGVLLLAIGAAGIAASFGLISSGVARTPLLWSGLLDLWRAIAPWSGIVTIVLGLLIAILGASLLGRLLRPAREPAMDEISLQDPDHHGPAERATLAPDLPGRTRVRGVVLAHGLERDLARDPQVQRAEVTLTGSAPEPDIWIELRVGPRARLSAVRDHVGAAVERFRSTTGLRPRRLDVTTRVDPAGAGRVR